MTLKNRTWVFTLTTPDGPHAISVQARTLGSATRRARVASSLLLETLGPIKLELKH